MRNFTFTTHDEEATVGLGSDGAPFAPGGTVWLCLDDVEGDLAEVTLTPEEARDLADALMDMADKAEEEEEVEAFVPKVGDVVAVSTPTLPGQAPLDPFLRREVVEVTDRWVVATALEGGTRGIPFGFDRDVAKFTKADAEWGHLATLLSGGPWPMTIRRRYEG